jgi:thiol:disulfide interchange protein DsbG
LLIEQGGEIVSQFDAPAGMKGNVAGFQGQVATFYRVTTGANGLDS